MRIRATSAKKIYRRMDGVSSRWFDATNNKKTRKLKNRTFCQRARRSAAYRILVNKMKEQLVSYKKKYFSTCTDRTDDGLLVFLSQKYVTVEVTWRFGHRPLSKHLAPYFTYQKTLFIAFLASSHQSESFCHFNFLLKTACAEAQHKCTDFFLGISFVHKR
jgi:hypothetical protein